MYTGRPWLRSVMTTLFPDVTMVILCIKFTNALLLWMFTGCYSYVNEPGVFCCVHISYLVCTCQHLQYLREMLSNLHFWGMCNFIYSIWNWSNLHFWVCVISYIPLENLRENKYPSCWLHVICCNWVLSVIKYMNSQFQDRGRSSDCCEQHQTRFSRLFLQQWCSTTLASGQRNGCWNGWN